MNKIIFPVTINKTLELEFFTTKERVIGFIADPTSPETKSHVLIENVSEPLRVPYPIRFVAAFLDQTQTMDLKVFAAQNGYIKGNLQKMKLNGVNVKVDAEEIGKVDGVEINFTAYPDNEGEGLEESGVEAKQN